MYISYKSPREVIKRFDTKISRSENHDCVVKAIATAFEITYNQSHKFCNKMYKRKDKRGVCGYIYHETNKKFSNDQTELFGKTMKEVGDKCEYTGEVRPFTYYKKPNIWLNKRHIKQCKMTVGTFIKEYPKGTFILSVRGHSFTVKDGTVIGNWEDSRKSRVRVEKAWEIL